MCELAKMPKKKIRLRNIKTADVKRLYAKLRYRIPELPINSKGFPGLNLMQLNNANQHLNNNGFILTLKLPPGDMKDYSAVLNGA